mgnify:CR=1 FL=1
MDPLTTSLGINLLATGIAAGADVTAGKVRDVLRRRQYDDDLEHVASVFAEELQTAIEAEHDRRDTNELAGVTDDWEAVVAEVIGSDTDEIGDDDRDRDDVGHLFADEEDAAIHIAEAIATVQGFDLADTPQLREELIAAVRNAYREAIVAFEGRIAETDLADVFQEELQLDIREAVGDLEVRVGKIGADVSALLTQDARNEGFRQLSPVYFERATPTPETSWRTTFTLADVEAGIPARRDGHGDQYADEELLAALREGEDRLVVGRAGAGKSTLCKQVAVAWYQDSELGEVLYRDSDAGGAFESTEALREAIDRGDGHVLVVVEDIIRANARAIADVIEEYDAVADVTFLLDARTEELDSDPNAQTLDRSGERRQIRVASSIERYYLPAISEADVERTAAAFENATGRTVDRSARELHDEIRAEQGEGIGRFLLLSFHLPFGDTEIERGGNESGLEDHVQSRYQTLMNPGGEEALRDLSRFEGDLLADVGVMVNLLNASGIGIYPELVHALGYEYGHNVKTHDEIEEIRGALEGWFLFPTTDDSELVRTTHELWSTLYLRAVARDYQNPKEGSRRRNLSEPHTARCLECICNVVNGEDQGENVRQEFPESRIIGPSTSDPENQLVTYIEPIFKLGERWPVLAPLFGNVNTARYELSNFIKEEELKNIITMRGNSHQHRGAYSKANADYERALEISQNIRDKQGIAESLNNLGAVATKQGNYDVAEKHHKQGLKIGRSHEEPNIIGISLYNLGKVEFRRENYKESRKYFKESLETRKKNEDQHGAAISLNGLGAVAYEFGNNELSKKYHKRSIRIAEDTNSQRLLAMNLNNMGRVENSEGNYLESKKYHKYSLQIRKLIDDQIGIATSLLNLGRVAEKEQNTKLAHDYYKDSFEKYREIGAIKRSLDSLDDLINICKETNRTDEAIKWCKKGLKILEDNNIQEDEKEYEIFEKHKNELRIKY